MRYCDHLCRSDALSFALDNRVVQGGKEEAHRALQKTTDSEDASRAFGGLELVRECKKAKI
jgi:hypothetical protein